MIVVMGLLAASFLGLLAEPAAGQETTQVVENGRVIVGDGTVLERASVVIAGNRIVSVTEEPVEALGATRIDAAGRSVLPGLIDTHVHLLVENTSSLPRSDDELQAFVRTRLPARLDAYLQAGITTVMSTGDFWPAIREVRERIRSDELTGPRVFTSGPVFTAPGGHPSAGPVCGPWREREANVWCRENMAVVVKDPRDAQDAVDRLAPEGVDLIKMVYDSISPPDVNLLEGELVAEIVQAAHDHGLRAYAHINDVKNAIEAIEAGVDGLVHTPFAATGSSERRELVAAVTARDVTVATTSVVLDVLTEVLARGGRSDRAEWVSGNLGSRQGMIARFADADDRVVVLGTDAPQLPPAEAYHREVRLARDAGLTAEQILRAATRNAAAHLGREESLGTLEGGKLADLIVVDGNPLEDLSALRNVELVVKGGKVVVSRE